MADAKSTGEKRSPCHCLMESRVAISPDIAHDMHETDTVSTWHMHLQGRVQGVGFRPHVYQKAIALGLNGTVSNGLDGVHIWLNTNERNAVAFLRDITNQPPLLAVITGSSLTQENTRAFSGFSIVHDREDIIPDLWITPDFAICETCKAELANPADRRHRYPFITCTQCGPRYSLMQALPFERHLTTMQSFTFCEACQQEFDDPNDRRFYAQTMSCPACGVQMQWMDANGKPIPSTDDAGIIHHACAALQQGSIVAVKGIGGFLLMADATNEAAIQRLRTRKHRPAKPFAIMYAGIAQLEKDTFLSEKQQAALTSLEAPIVLLPVSEKMQESLALEALAPRLDKLGIMLPYAPLLYLMAQSFAKPLVATSGNVSGAPICFTNASALTSLTGIADFFLLHNREIVTPQDDSVISIPDENYPAIRLRRSRGYAPACEAYRATTNKSVLATGALMKSSFTLAHHQRVYVSQYLGNTDSYEAQQAYKHTLKHMQQLLQFEPEIILADTHPQYFSHQLAQELAISKNIPFHTVQHHKAHFAAILGERGLTDVNSGILGIVWDGTGRGDDGNSWGGEFFTYADNTIQRINHFSYFPYLLGDKMAMEPRLSALSLLHASGDNVQGIQSMFTEKEWRLYRQMLANYSGINTSSVGRLFDAAACLITGIAKQSYEGEAAMRLEALANKWCRKNGFDIKDSFLRPMHPAEKISTTKILSAIQQALENGAEPSYLAATFHATLVDVVGIMAGHLNRQHVCFSGGVFQNTLLVNMIIEKYSKQLHLHFHRDLSPNDENISFGQLVYFDRQMQ
jgi:hydrogenase maturation protein HypF